MTPLGALIPIEAAKGLVLQIVKVPVTVSPNAYPPQGSFVKEAVNTK